MALWLKVGCIWFDLPNETILSFIVLGCHNFDFPTSFTFFFIQGKTDPGYYQWVLIPRDTPINLATMVQMHCVNITLELSLEKGELEGRWWSRETSFLLVHILGLWIRTWSKLMGWYVSKGYQTNRFDSFCCDLVDAIESCHRFDGASRAAVLTT